MGLIAIPWISSGIPRLDPMITTFSPALHHLGDDRPPVELPQQRAVVGVVEGHGSEVVVERVEGPHKPYRFFTAEEVRTLEAVASRVLPQEDRTPDRRVPILPKIDERLHEDRLNGYRYEDMPPDQEAYRLAARAFELMAQRLRGCRFDQMEVHDQELFLKSIHDAEPLEAREEWNKMNVERFWTLLVTDVAGTYYAHPWAWDEIGFGGPAYPRGYMRLRNGEPEPYEVRERRYAWAAPSDTLSDVEEQHGTGKEHQTGDEADCDGDRDRQGEAPTQEQQFEESSTAHGGDGTAAVSSGQEM